MTTQQCLEQFQNVINVMGLIGGSVRDEPPGMQKAVANKKGKKTATTKNEAQEWHLTIAFLLGMDQNRHGRLIKNLKNDHLQG